ncbi:MAG: ABC transporter permease [Alistipes sp.]|nr:ABC transporter permease [Alistipes sp.]
MNTPLLIARRTAQSTTSTQRIMVHIATLAVAVSVAVMIVTVAVVSGFKEQVRGLIGGFTSEVTVTDLSTYGTGNTSQILDTPSLRSFLAESCPDVDITIDAYATRGGVLRSEVGSVAIMVKGVDSLRTLAPLQGRVTEGVLPATGGARRRELLISSTTAQSLGVGVGDRVELLLTRGEGLPQREVMKVCGIYASAGEEMGGLSLADIRNVRRMNGWQENGISGYEISTHGDDAVAAEVASRLNMRLIFDYTGDENLTAVTMQELHPSIFSWLGTHDVNAAVVVVIMVVVALFNMATALLILVLERTRMVGVLKSLGMSNRQVRRIFHYRAAMLIARGVGIGAAVALVAVLVQRYTHCIALDAEAYYVDHVPVAVEAWWVVLLCVAFALVVLLLLSLTTSIVARIEPAEAIKYE